MFPIAVQLTATGFGVSYSAVLSGHVLDGTCRPLRALHTLGDEPLPDVVHEATGELSPELVRRNDLGVLTFRIGDRFLQVESATYRHRPRPRAGTTRVDLGPAPPAPRVIAADSDDEARIEHYRALRELES